MKTVNESIVKSSIDCMNGLFWRIQVNTSFVKVKPVWSDSDEKELIHLLRKV